MTELTKKLTTLALFISLVGTLAITSCGDTGASGSSDTSAADTSAAESTSTDLMKDALPEVDYDGYEFRIYSRAQPWFHGNMLVEEANGEVLNDAIYNRNSDVSDRFNVTFSEITSTSTDVARNAIIAGDDAFDLINARCSHAWSYAEEGLLLELNDLPYIDLTRGYWDASLNDCLSVCGKSYFAVGASNLTGYDYTHVMVFNKSIIEDNKLDDPYELVSSGKWTLDSFERLTKNVTVDINGDSKYDDKDSYGFLAQAKAVLPAFWIASDVLSINMNSKDEPEFTMPSDTKFLEVFEKTFNITWDNSSWFVHLEQKNYDDKLTQMFRDNQGLFMDITFFYIEALRDMEMDFGIIPYPKYDEAQENYLARIEGCELPCVPVTVKDAERTSVVIEALAAASVNVVSAYYDVALKTKYTRDNQSSEMLDIIFDNRVFDLGDTIWCDDLRDGVFRTMFGENDRAISSKFASMQTVMTEKLTKTIEAFSD